MSDFNYDDLDPGIRETVRRLNEWGYETSDSGDGVSKTDMECAMSVPHVVIASTADTLIEDARRLRKDLDFAGFCVEPMAPDGSGISIEASYCPANDHALLMLFGVTDGAWKS